MFKNRLLMYSLSAVFLINITAAHAQEWSRYAPSKSRGDIIKKARRNSGTGASVATNLMILTYWVTDSAARALISNMVDRERLTEEEANNRYQMYRKADRFVFVVEIKELAAGYSRGSLNETANPLRSSEIFLQREDNRKEFVKGSIEESEYDFLLGSGKQTNTYLLTFPRTTRDGQPLIRSLDDRIEIQVSLKGKIVVLDYKIKDLVIRVEDL